VWSLVFLLEPSASSVPISKPSSVRTIADVTGEALDIAGPDGLTLTLLFDPKSHRPVLFSLPWDQTTSRGDRTAQTTRTGRLLDYRRIGNTWFPFGIDESTGPYRAKLEVTAVTVNPPGVDQLFQRRPQ